MKKTILALSKCLFLIFFVSSTTFAQSAYEQAEKAYIAEDYSKAFELFEPLANAGNDDAQYYMGIMYHFGDGVRQSYEKAYEWYLKSAEAGDLDSQYRVATLYEDGDGIREDKNKAFNWFLKSAQQGHKTSQFKVAFYSDDGSIIDQDYEQAAYWYQKAGEQGDPTSLAYLGELYQNGKGVSENLERAIELYMEAIGIENQEYAVSKLNSIIEDNTPDNTSQSPAFAMASDLFRAGNVSGAVNAFQKLAGAGDRDAQVLVGSLYQSGQGGLAQSDAQANHWFLKSALKGLASGQYSLGAAYGNGQGVEKNLNLARFWFEKAADQGHEAARQALTQF